MFSVFKGKFVDFGIPMLNFNSYTESKINNTKLKIIYAGSFYKKIRNPKYMLEVLNSVAELIDCEIHIYGPTKETISQYNQNKFKRIISHGKVPKVEIETALLQSDILVNIGNKVSNQLPSKVLEYISLQIPIINFYSIQDDTSNYYLEKYPCALLVPEEWSKLDDSVELVINFIEESKRLKCDENELKLTYNNFMISSLIKKIQAYI